MSQTHKKTLAVACAAAIAQNLRVKYDGSFNLVVATAADVCLGTLRDASFAAGDVRTVNLRNDNDTKVMVANAAITKGTYVFAAAAGKVGPTGTIIEGLALEAAAADGDWIEVLPLDAAIPESVGAVAAAGSVQGDAAALTSNINVVSAADATKGVILPTAYAGAKIIVKNNVNAVLKVYPATGGAINAIAANGAISQAALTCCIFVATSATQWFTIPLLPS